MMTQTDMFAPADQLTKILAVDRKPNPTAVPKAPIAIPCGFRDRHSNPCKRVGNWPVMVDGIQLVCRDDRPMVHCNLACFKGDAPAARYGTDDDDVIWEGQEGEYDHER